MTHTYKITGMTCDSCETKVKSSLLMLPHVTDVEVSKEKQSAMISMDKHISLATLQQALNSKYSISAIDHNEAAEQAKSWLATYKPLLLLFGFITVISIIAAANDAGFSWMHGMNTFMAGFFIAFSFFKLLDLQGFVDSYRMYDIVAKKVKTWAYMYPFVELALGLAFAAGFQPQLTNIVTLVVMTVSIIGVLQSVLNKSKIQCACLGAVFDLPMSTVTIIEDVLMIGMSVLMLLTMGH